jgi:hypothetical protein
MGRKAASRSGIREEQPGSYFLELRNHFFCFFGVKILKFFYADPGSEMETVRIRDEKKSDPGSGINIPDPQHCLIYEENFVFFFISADEKSLQDRATRKQKQLKNRVTIQARSVHNIQNFLVKSEKRWQKKDI